MKKLSEEEIVALVLDAQKGCNESKNKLTIHFNPLIKLIIKQAGFFTDIEDAVQTGMIGLTKAINEFDAEKGSKFKSYLYPVSKGEILRYYRSCRQLKIPRPLHEKASAINKFKNDYLMKNEKLPTTQQIIDELSFSSKEINLAKGINRKCLPIHEAQTSNRSFAHIHPFSLEELIGSDENPYEKKDWSYTLKDIMQNTLSPIEQKIIHWRIFMGVSQNEAAEKLNTNQMYISRTERRAFKKLREEIVKKVI